MSCELFREVLSARLDGEDGPPVAGGLDAHLETCSGCRTYASGIGALRRRTAVRPAEAVPDLTARILADAPDLGTASAAPQAPADPAPVPPPSGPHWSRFALLGVALTQLLLALHPVLFASRPVSSAHLSHELGAWDLALAGALLLVVARPRHAAGLLPFAASLAAAMSFSAAVDVTAGRTGVLGESQHLLELAGLALLWVISRTPADDEPLLGSLRRSRAVLA